MTKRLPKEWKEPDPIEEKLRKFLNSVWREIRINYKIMLDWYFFYKPDSKGDKALHIIMVGFVNLVLLRFFGLI